MPDFKDENEREEEFASGCPATADRPPPTVSQRPEPPGLGGSARARGQSWKAPSPGTAPGRGHPLPRDYLKSSAKALSPTVTAMVPLPKRALTKGLW